MRNAIIGLCVVAALLSCNNERAAMPSCNDIMTFTSSDSTLEECYQWAKTQALAYAHDGTDSVGYWYEAALPSREAFCMRDVSHQSVGAQILGLKEHNLNMLKKFAENISESKDWCTYWEINRYDRPAPVDYANDKEFWYNLNANFDVTYACMKMYEWTGDERYLKEDVFTNFYEKTFDNYVDHWMLDIDHVMDRPLYMHSPEPFDPEKSFHACRGLPSYVESFSGMTMSLDLVTSLYIGHKTYADILTLNGEAEKAATYAARADAYRQLMDATWWDAEKQYYNTFYTTDKEFHKGEGVTFALWYNAIHDADRIWLSIADLLSHDWNVENLSYFPAMLFRYGYDKPARDYLIKLRNNRRCTYPEVSFAWMEGLVSGYMGIQPEASKGSISTLLHAVDDDIAEVRNVPVWDGYLTLKHNGHHESTLKNQTGKTFVWKAQFEGHHGQAWVNGKKHDAEQVTDILGNAFTVVKVDIANGKTYSIKVE